MCLGESLYGLMWSNHASVWNCGLRGGKYSIPCLNEQCAIVLGGRIGNEDFKQFTWIFMFSVLDCSISPRLSATPLVSSLRRASILARCWLCSFSAAVRTFLTAVKPVVLCCYFVVVAVLVILYSLCMGDACAHVIPGQTHRDSVLVEWSQILVQMSPFPFC